MANVIMMLEISAIRRLKDRKCLKGIGMILTTQNKKNLNQLMLFNPSKCYLFKQNTCLIYFQCTALLRV